MDGQEIKLINKNRSLEIELIKEFRIRSSDALDNTLVWQTCASLARLSIKCPSGLCKPQHETCPIVAK